MATSVVPALIDAIVSNARTALPNLNVFDGYGVTDDPGGFLMVGVSDPDTDQAAESASATQDWASLGARTRDETGDIWCVALSWTGDATDQKGARDSAYATVSAVENMLRNDPTLGNVPGLLWSGFGSSHTLKQDQTEDGAIAQVAFQIHFRARI